MTLLLSDPAAARAWGAEVRAAGETLGFVPTMGALHRGHQELVRASVAENDRTCVSLFVNPLQFDEPRDFERYPRDLAADTRLLSEVGCDVAFSGTLEQFFPEARGRADAIPLEDPGPAAEGLEGSQRAGHFAGVATIVRRLFEIVEPDVAYFGEKDFQQTLVVRDLARRLGAPRISVRPTVRDPSGLALSSRNALLGAREREDASALSRGLFAARRAFREGIREARDLSGIVEAELAAGPLWLEYSELRDPEDWSRGPLVGRVSRAQALAAARLGAVRLIDNLRLDGAGE